MRSLAPSSYELSSLFLSPPLSAPKISQTLYFLCSFPIPNPSLRLCHRRSPGFAFAFSSKNPQRQDLLSSSDPSEDEDEDDEEDDDDEAAVAAAEEYDEALVEVSEEEEEEFGVELSSSRSEVKEGNKLQRIERVFALVKELGDDILDFDEIASVYDFPVDKFQVLIH